MIKSTIATVLAGAALLGAPAYASPSSTEIKTANTILRGALQAGKAKNWSKACSEYKRYVAYKQKTGALNYTVSTPGDSARLRQLNDQYNRLVKQGNGMINDNGSFLCGKAKATWHNVKLPAYPGASTSSVTSNIRARCEKEWGTDYRMVRYCVDKQTTAARSLGY